MSIKNKFFKTQIKSVISQSFFDENTINDNYLNSKDFFSNFENCLPKKSSAINWDIEDNFWQEIIKNDNCDRNGRKVKPGDLLIGGLLADNISNYKYNSRGYRSQEFINKPDLLVAGCSFTFGMGCQEEDSWPQLISKDLNLNMVNIGYPGASVQKIVIDIFKYCNEFGNPKNIICLFPDFYRILFARNKFIMIDNHDKKTLLIDKNSGLNLIRDMQTEAKGLNYKPEKYVKTPISAEEFIPPELTYMLAIHNIIMLEQYCRSNGINLYYSSWSVESEIAMDSIKNNADSLNSFYSYFDSVSKKISDQFNIPLEESYPHVFLIQANENSVDKTLCHNNLFEKNKDIFLRGTDRYFISPTVAKNESHPGTHYHAHVAEHFKELMLNENNRI